MRVKPTSSASDLVPARRGQLQPAEESPESLEAQSNKRHVSSRAGDTPQFGYTPQVRRSASSQLPTQRRSKQRHSDLGQTAIADMSQRDRATAQSLAVEDILSREGEQPVEGRNGSKLTTRVKTKLKSLFKRKIDTEEETTRIHTTHWTDG